MDLQYLKKIVRLLEQSGVDEIEIEEEGIKIRVSKNAASNGSAQQVFVSGHPANSPAPIAVPATPEPAVSAPEPPPQNVTPTHEVRSPIVGTFYRAPAPDADPYVEIGQVVEKGTILCIIEAMKLMNEIESDAGGRIVKILVDNAKPVEYNQPLFIIEPV
ncbi:MAG: acetyl-CoA carboxylase biotin carboxyl carrier protein [Bacteroidota bacterium]